MTESRLSSLPDDQFARVLQRIDQEERVGSCSLVNSAWNRAVKSTFRSLTCRLRNAAQYESLSSWLNSSSSVSDITYIDVINYEQLSRRLLPTGGILHIADLPSLQLPYTQLSKLQTLKLFCCLLRPTTAATDTHTVVASRAASLHPLSALTALTQLRLDRCYVKLYELFDCTQLQYLDLDLMTFSDGQVPASDGSMQAVETVLAGALSGLQRLTYLSVARASQGQDTRWLDFDPISAALSDLPQLCELHLGQNVTISGSSFACLPTSLDTAPAHINCTPDVETTPRPQQLSTLRRLQLRAVTIHEPAVLLRCPHLTRLELVDVFVTLGVDPAVDILPAEDQEVTLLAVLPGLTQLQHLVLSDFVGELPVESYAAITASSQLTYLDLIGCEIDPSAAWQIFSPGRCSNLAELKVAPPLLSSSGSYDMLVRCCPALQHLKVGHVLSIGDYRQTDEEGLTALRSLTALSKLCMVDVNISTVALHNIASCQQLQELVMWGVVKGNSFRGLTQLTQLTRLTSLALETYHAGDDQHFSFTSEVAAGRPHPDVAQQLLLSLQLAEPVVPVVLL